MINIYIVKLCFGQKKGKKEKKNKGNGKKKTMKVSVWKQNIENAYKTPNKQTLLNWFVRYMHKYSLKEALINYTLKKTSLSCCIICTHTFYFTQTHTHYTKEDSPYIYITGSPKISTTTTA